LEDGESRRMVGTFIGEVDGIACNVALSVLINNDRTLWLIRGDIAIAGTGTIIAAATHELFDRVLGIAVLAQPEIKDGEQGAHPCLVVQADDLKLVQ
jgi:mRNA-degrading endonuclease toxin of MazEF toxin-antitoxin module